MRGRARHRKKVVGRWASYCQRPRLNLARHDPNGIAEMARDAADDAYLCDHGFGTWVDLDRYIGFPEGA